MTDKTTVLITAPYFIPVFEEYREQFEREGIKTVIHPVAERASEAELLDLIEGIDGVLCGDDEFTRRVIERADRLKVISKWGTGIDSIDQDACAEHGVAVRNTPGAFTIPVADSVIGYMLLFVRRLDDMDRMMKEGQWEKIGGTTLSESTIGIVGVGDIGSEIARRLAPFGATLLGNDIVSIPVDLLDGTGMRSVSFEGLLGASDIVSINCDLNPTSRGLIDRESLALMKSDSYLINLARGPIVVEEDLIEALSSGDIAGAALDVYEDEPLPLDSPLRRMDNVFLAPHNANSSPRAWERIHDSTLGNLLSELRKRT